MLQATGLSLAARGLRSHLETHSELEELSIQICHPEKIETANNKHLVSIYFYRLYESGNSGYLHPGMPVDIVAHCLITAFGQGEQIEGETSAEGMISAGESDLAILGKIIKSLHENPILIVRDLNEDDLYKIEISPQTLTIDEISKIVPNANSTLGFRPSIAYSLSLIPLPPGKAESGLPVLVIAWGVEADAKKEKPFPQNEINIYSKSTKPSALPSFSDLHLIFTEDNEETGANTLYSKRVSSKDLEKTGLYFYIKAELLQNTDKVIFTHEFWLANEIEYQQLYTQQAVFNSELENSWENSDFSEIEQEDGYFKIGLEASLNPIQVGQHKFSCTLLRYNEESSSYQTEHQSNPCMLALVPENLTV